MTIQITRRGVLKGIGTAAILGGVSLFKPKDAHAAAGPSYDVYTEGWQSGWSHWSWGISTNPASPGFRGGNCLQAIYNSAWAGFSPAANAGFATIGYKHITFAIYNQTNGDDLYFTAMTTDRVRSTILHVPDYAETGAIPTNKWTWIRIPISDLNLGSAPIFSTFWIDSSKPATVYFDEITFGASVTFYEGVSGEKGPGTQLWSWGVSVSQPLDIGSTDNYILQVSPTQPWGGIQLQQRKFGIGSPDYGGVTLRFKQASAAQNLYLSLINQDNQLLGTVALDETYLPATLGTIQANTWYRVIVPLSDFCLCSANLGGVAIETDQQATFYVDDVRLVQKLAWPRMDGVHSVNFPGNGGSFGDHWQTSYCTESGLTDKKLLHNGTDYLAPAGTDIRAASRGVVKFIGSLGAGWGNVIVIEHEDGLTTHYLHTDAVAGLQIGDEVQRGQQIGDTSAISGAHLHFGLRVLDYQPPVDPDWINYPIRGRLPEVMCKTAASPTYQEKKFPYSYLNTEIIDW